MEAAGGGGGGIPWVLPANWQGPGTADRPRRPRVGGTSNYTGATAQTRLPGGGRLPHRAQSSTRFPAWAP